MNVFVAMVTNCRMTLQGVTLRIGGLTANGYSKVLHIGVPVDAPVRRWPSRSAIVGMPTGTLITCHFSPARKNRFGSPMLVQSRTRTELVSVKSNTGSQLVVWPTSVPVSTT